MLQVHDSIVFQIPLAAGWVRHAEIITEIKERLERPVTYHDRTITIPAEVTLKVSNLMTGWDLLENKLWNPDWNSPPVLAKRLEAEYTNLLIT